MNQRKPASGPNSTGMVKLGGAAGLVVSLAIGMAACSSDVPTAPGSAGPATEPASAAAADVRVGSPASRLQQIPLAARIRHEVALRAGGRIPTGQVRTRFAPNGISVAADQVVIKVARNAVDRLDTVDEALGALGATLAYFDPSTRTGWVRFDGSHGGSVDQLVSQIATIAGVSGVRYDPIAYATGGGGHSLPSNGHGHGPQNIHDNHGHAGHWGPQPQGQKQCDPGADYDGASLWHLAALRMGGAWHKRHSASPVVIAMLDTGLSTDADGVALAPGLETATILPGYDFVNLDDDPADDNGHGTLLAGVIASTGVFPGVAPGARILPVKVLDAGRKGNEAALVEGINYAVAQGADVISMSLAFPVGFMPSPDLAKAVQDAAAAGVLIIAASGNHGKDEVSFPAAFGEVIAVGAGRMGKPFAPVSLACAVDKKSAWLAGAVVRAEYSGYGAPIDVCAPGGSMNHDLDQDGRPDAIPAFSFAPATPNQYEAFLVAGTSPASAEVAGISALFLAAGAEPGDMRALLQSSARSMDGEGFQTSCGSGLVDATAAMTELQTGRIPELPARYANPIVTLVRDSQGMRRAMALVEIIDQHNDPVPGVTVLGHFRGPVGHDVSAVTDDHGRVLMTSLPAGPSAGIFEFSVDKILEWVPDQHHGHHHHDHDIKCGDDDDDDVSGAVQVIIPRSFERFEAASFRWLTSFQAEGSGIEPSPWSIAIDPDALSPYIGEFGANMIHGADPSAPVTKPVTTIPADYGTWTVVPSLVTRTLGGDVAPVTIAIDRAAIVHDCGLSDALLPVLSVGAGIEPSPWRLNQSLLSEPITVNEVLVRADGLFQNGHPATETSLGLLFGEQGKVLIDVEGSLCDAHSVVLADLGRLSDAVLGGQSVADGGFHLTVDNSGSPPPPASGPIPLDDTALGAAQAEAPFASGVYSEASAAVGDGDGSGVQPMP